MLCLIARAHGVPIPGGRAETTRPSSSPRRILLQPRSGVSSVARDVHRVRHGLRLVREYPGALNGLQVMELPAGRAASLLIEGLEGSAAWDWIEIDRPVSILADEVHVPVDPKVATGEQWHLNNFGQNGGKRGADVQAIAGWETTRAASNVVVAIVDTGVRYTHEDLAGNMWINPGEIPGNGVDDDKNGYVDDLHGINAATNSGDPIDDFGHGTQVAGVVGAVGDDGVGISGIAWRIQLMACRFYDSTGSGTISDVIECLDYARRMGAHIINASFGDTNDSRALQLALRACRNSGILVTAGAGNRAADMDAEPFYPAAYDLDNIVSVGASTRFDTLADLSSYGLRLVDLMAPGDEILTSFHRSDSDHTINRGTSFSAPLAAGALALLKTRFPGDSYRELIERLLTSVDPIPSLAGRCVSGGRLNLARALGPALVPGFTASPDLGSAPLRVQFTNNTLGDVADWRWDFGDGSTSTEREPAHVFSASDTYTVTLHTRSIFGRTGTVEATLSAEPAPTNPLRLSPTESWSVSGTAGEMPAEEAWLLSLSNTGGQAVEFQASFSAPWGLVNTPAGTVAPRSSRLCVLQLTPEVTRLPAGSHIAHLLIGDHHRTVMLNLAHRVAVTGLSATAEGNGYQLAVQGQPGASYTLLASEDLIGWRPVGEVSIGGDGFGSATLPVDPSTPAQYFTIQP